MKVKVVVKIYFIKENGFTTDRKKSGKYKYIYPLTKELKDKCLELKKPYPKNASKA